MAENKHHHRPIQEKRDERSSAYFCFWCVTENKRVEQGFETGGVNSLWHYKAKQIHVDMNRASNPFYIVSITFPKQQQGRKQPLNDIELWIKEKNWGGSPPPLYSGSHPRRHTQRQIRTLLFSSATQGETSAKHLSNIYLYWRCLSARDE